MNALIRFAVLQRWFVMLAVAIMMAIGGWAYTQLPIDAVPDITNVQVQINASAPGYSPLEAEQRITFPVETAMAGLPNLDYTRSLSRYGLSQVTVAFKDGTDLYFARQLIGERLQQVRQQLPDGIDVELGPIATGLGEIFQYLVEAKPGATNGQGAAYSPTELKTIHDWIIRPQLRNVSGVIEVNAIGGFTKQFQVVASADRLMAFGLSFRNVIDALARNNANVGAGYIERNGEQLLIRAPGQVSSVEDIANITIGSHKGVPIHVRDIARVETGGELRTGAATHNGKEVVLGTAVMLIGENSRTVSQSVSAAIRDISASLPPGVEINPVYNRTDLVDRTIQTVATNLVEGAILVIVVIYLFLGNIRAALIVGAVIPLSMLFTMTGMVTSNVSANLMSLGALDFGIIVDVSIIVVENCMRLLAHEQARQGRQLSLGDRLEIVHRATREVVSPAMFGVAIIMIVYLPILTLTGVEGKMFSPMAITVLLALTGAAILSVTFVPAAAALFITGEVHERESFIVRGARALYGPMLAIAIANRAVVLAGAAVLTAVCLLLATRLGSEFIPSLDEGDVALHAMRIPGTSLTQAVEMQRVLEARINQLPEVKEVFSKIGTAEVATDPMPPNVADTFVMLKPRSQWPDPSKSKTEIVKDLQQAAAEVPGNNYEFTQPIQMRFNELISGVRSDVGLKLYGDDLDQLLRLGNEAAAILRSVPGAADTKVEQIAGLPVLTIRLDRVKLARYGLSIADAQEVIEIAIGGKAAGQVFEGDRRFDLVVKLPEAIRADIEALSRLPVPIPPHGDTDETLADIAEDAGLAGQSLPRFVPLQEIADISLAPGPNQISRENGKRRIVVTTNVRDRDLGSFVTDAQSQVAERLKLPAGYWSGWGGQFEQLMSATARLAIVVPIALALILLLLFMSLSGLKEALIVFTGVPLALTGGIVALWLRDIPLSISASVGFIALSGVAVLDGLVMMQRIQRLRESGSTLNDAVIDGSLSRLRAVLLTGCVAAIGFVPMAIATGPGAEVQRPLATVVIGGVISSTLLTLFVLPALYRFFNREDGIAPAKSHS